MPIKMKELPETERPYEKLEQYGEKMLTNAELLAIIIKTGTKEETAVGLAQQILKLNPGNQNNLNFLFLILLLAVIYKAPSTKPYIKNRIDGNIISSPNATIPTKYPPIVSGLLFIFTKIIIIEQNAITIWIIPKVSEINDTSKTFTSSPFTIDTAAKPDLIKIKIINKSDMVIKNPIIKSNIINKSL